MTNRDRLTIGLAALLLAVPAAAVTIREDFSGLGPTETSLPSLATAIGLITGLDGVPFANVYLAPPGYDNFGAGTNPTTTTILTANGDEWFDVALIVPARSIRLDAWLTDLGPASLIFYSGTGTIGSVGFAADADNRQHVRYVSAQAPITRFTFQSTQGRLVNTGIGNIAITAVPEPGGWALLATGFALMGTLTRRRTVSVAA